MPTTIPAIHGKFGTNEYYVVTMSVAEFVRTVRLPKELPGWDDLSIEERYQRDINISRIRKYIAPYYAMDPDRFSSALVLAVTEAQQMVFEPLADVSRLSGIPALYKSATRDMGFLTLPTDGVLVPLDGQHRAKAFKYAIDGADDNNRAIEGIKSNLELAKDTVAVILVPFETKRSRRIFNKINRYAKPTTKADNLITDDDDSMAVMTRWLLGEDGVLPSRIVRIGANTLSKKAPEFTTLATFYDSTIAIVEGLGIAGKGSPSNMSDDEIELVRDQIKDIWRVLFDGVDLWKKAIDDPSENGDANRIKIRDETLLGKPVGQLSLVRAFMMMRDRCECVPMEELYGRLNQLSWDIKDPTWRGVLVNPNGRVMSGKNTVNRACEFIAHLGGVALTEDEKERLLEHIHGDEWQEKELPSPVA